MPSSHFILCCPLLILPPIPPSIRVFSSESTLHMRWPKYWIFSFSISPSKEHPVLISFRMDWLDLLAVQGTLKRILQHHSSKASIFRRSKQRTPLCSRIATGISWSSLGGLKGVKPPEVPVFCHKSDVICISEIIDISPSNLDSSLCFMQSSISHDVLYI